MRVDDIVDARLKRVIAVGVVAIVEGLEVVYY
jgi:hypothetical protein